MGIYSKINTARRIMFDKNYRFLYLASTGFYNLLNDEAYIKKRFRRCMGYDLNLTEPKTYNEKLQWLKLYDRKDIYTIMVDKYAAKDYVASIIGEEHIIPTLGIWDHFDDIDFDSLPNQFVLKCTHDSGGLVIVKDKSKFDRKAARKKIENSLNHNFYYIGREWPYKNVKPRIIVEQYMEDSVSERTIEKVLCAVSPNLNELQSNHELKDYKFFCFNGSVKFFKVDYDRFTDHHANYYDLDMNLLPFGEARIPPREDKHIERPKRLEEMVRIAEKLAEGHDFLRVDLYESDEQVYFGEITFFPDSGFGKLTDEKYDKYLGDMLVLTQKKKLTGGGITDYKFFCFNGVVDNAMIVEDRESGAPKFFHVDMNGNILPYNRMGRYLPNNVKMKLVPEMEQMKAIAEKLSKGLPHVRIDLYDVNGKIYFGEYTFYNQSGFEDGFGEESDLYLGSLIDLSKVYIDNE